MSFLLIIIVALFVTDAAARGHRNNSSYSNTYIGPYYSSYSYSDRHGTFSIMLPNEPAYNPPPQQVIVVQQAPVRPVFVADVWYEHCGREYHDTWRAYNRSDPPTPPGCPSGVRYYWHWIN